MTQLSCRCYQPITQIPASFCVLPAGKLYYNWSNICMHYFSLPWLATAAEGLAAAATYHIAHKQIPSVGGVKLPGVKLEMFIFDPFNTADKVTLYEV
jgi:UDP-N-acetylglucosamine/UDP-N-acetylgalactosamine diphosphorylase